MGQLIDLAEYRATHGPAVRCVAAAGQCWWAWWVVYAGVAASFVAASVSGLGKKRD